MDKKISILILITLFIIPVMGFTKPILDHQGQHPMHSTSTLLDPSTVQRLDEGREGTNLILIGSVAIWAGLKMAKNGVAYGFSENAVATISTLVIVTGGVSVVAGACLVVVAVYPQAFGAQDAFSLDENKFWLSVDLNERLLAQQQSPENPFLKEDALYSIITGLKVLEAEGDDQINSELREKISALENQKNETHNQLMSLSDEDRTKYLQDSAKIHEDMEASHIQDQIIERLHAAN